MAGRSPGGSSKRGRSEPIDVSALQATVTDAAREVARFVPDTVAMLRGVLTDPRVPHTAKVEAGAALAYLVSPVNKLTNWVPVVGKVDDVAVVAFALRRLLVGAGGPGLREHRRGHPPGPEGLLGVAAAVASPRGLPRGGALMKALMGAGGGGVRRPGSGRVVEGEVLNRRNSR